jgi:hypothetical protein
VHCEPGFAPWKGWFVWATLPVQGLSVAKPDGKGGFSRHRLSPDDARVERVSRRLP